MKVALAARRADDLARWRRRPAPRPLPATRPTALRWRSSSRTSRPPSATPDVVVYNASYRTRGPFIELDPDEVEKSINVTAFAGFLVAQEAARRMLPQHHGAIMFTGASASVKGYAQSAPFAMGKFALRGLAQSMARELAPQGIHVAHVVVDGGIQSERRPDPPDKPDSMLDPDAIAAELSGSAAAAAQRLGLGDRAAAVGGEVLNLMSRSVYSRAMPQDRRLPPLRPSRLLR